jgi:hypothetical protein
VQSYEGELEDAAALSAVQSILRPWMIPKAGCRMAAQEGLDGYNRQV